MKPVLFDVTHLRHNAGKNVRSGIRRVDLDYAAHFFLDRGDADAVQYGEFGPSRVKPKSSIERIIRDSQSRLRADDRPTEAFAAVTAWLQGEPYRRSPTRARAADRLHDARSYARFLSPPSRLGEATFAPGSVYLNVAQHALFHGAFFRWLRVRRDIRPVFFVHDLLPMQQPEFWPAGYRERFARGFSLWSEVGAAFITSSQAVKHDLLAALAAVGRHDVPILGVPLPTSLAGTTTPKPVEALAAVPYFVMLGTIEPRKNHMLILNAWRRLCERPGPVPKLIVAGRRGWETQQVVAMLERCAPLQAHVLEVPDLGDRDIEILIGHARALLFPSFGEGYGLPLGEALALGTPVLAADLPILRESTQGRALFEDPLDGPGWIAAITSLSDPKSPMARHARALAGGFQPIRAADHFAAVDRFIDSL